MCRSTSQISLDEHQFIISLAVHQHDGIKMCCVGCNNGNLFLKDTHDYWHQVQGQLHITGYQCCDLVVWTIVDCQIIRIKKDLPWAENLSRLIEFYFDKFIPSLVA